VKVGNVFAKARVNSNPRDHAPFCKSPIAALIAGMAVFAAVPAHGQAAADEKEAAATAESQALEGVTVRRRPQIEKLKDVPVSVSVVSGGELDRELAQDLGAITKRAASVSFNQSNTRGGSLSIRGLGKRAFSELQDPSVLLIVDDVSYGLTQLGNFDFYDIDSVEVYRGPQGTAGGKGASSGALVVHSKAPSFVPTADYQITYGQRDTVIAKAALGGPVVEDLLAWRGSFIVNKGRGYYGNAYNERGNYSLYNKDRISARTQFLLTPTTDFRALFSVEIEPHTTQLQNGLNEYVDRPLRYADGSLTDAPGTTPKSILTGYTNAAGVFTGPRAWFANRGVDYNNTYLNSTTRAGSVNFNQTEGQFVSTKGGSLKLDWDLADDYTLTSITGYRNYSFDARNDEGTPFDVSKNGGGGVFYSQFTEELRLASARGGFFDYVTGLYLMNTRDTVESKAGWGSDAGAWFASSAQYNALERNAGVNRGSGLALLRDSLADTFRIADTNVKTKSEAIFGQGNFHFTPDLTLTTGLRLTREDRKTEDWASLVNNGVGGALNPVSVRSGSLGGFDSVAFTVPTGVTGAAGDLTASNSPTQLALADAVANRYFGATVTGTPGQAYNSLTAAQKRQVAAAKAVRAAQIGSLVSGVRASYKDTLATGLLSPSYKFSENLTGYASWQYGEKSGTAITVNGSPVTVKPEKTQAFEIGFKSSLLDRTLVLNADVFLMNIKDYQQTVRAVDEFATQTNITNGDSTIAYTSVQGNVDKVRSKGLELDGVYTGIRNTSIRFSGSYNDTSYVKFTNAAKPVELTYLPGAFIDQSGKPVSGAPKVLLNIGAEYRLPIAGDRILHTSFNTSYTTRYNNDELLSDYSWVPASSTTDLSIGIGTARKGFDVTLVARNAFDSRAHEKGWVSYEPNPYPRWLGIVLSSSL